MARRGELTTFLDAIAVRPLRASVTALLLIASSGYAQIIAVSNLANSTTGERGALTSSDLSAFEEPAGSFTTGSSITTLFNLTLTSPYSDNPAGMRVSLYSNSNSGTPGALLETLSSATGPSSGEYSFTSGGTTTLSANTTYWWVATFPSDGQYRMKTTTVTTETSTSGWTIGDSYGFQDNSAGWSIHPGEIIQFSVSVTSAIPEPGTYAAFAGIATLLLAGYIRRRA